MHDYIGLAGWARSGKDTLGEILEAHYGYHKMAFADSLREFLIGQNPWVLRDDQGDVQKLSIVIDKYGWDGYKNSPFGGDIRALIQRTGTEGGRKCIYEDVWVDATMRKAAEYEKVVFTDVRFPNEARAVLERGKDAQVWWVERPGVEAANDHSSENAMNDFDFPVRIKNDSGIEALSMQVRPFLVN